MGLFVDYMTKFVFEYNKANGIPTRKLISDWFGCSKKAILRNGYEDQMIFSKKSAVVLVGVSCIGKSTYVKNFIKMCPDFAYVSYDDCCYQNVDEGKAGREQSETRIVEILEENMLKNNDRNIVVDAHCINPASRAALMRFLNDLGYEIFVVYFSKAYTEANIGNRLLSRAIELTLYQDYLKSTDTSHMTIREIMVVRENIVSYMAKKKNLTEEELINQTAKRTETTSNLVGLRVLYEDEVETNRMWWQEKRGLFLLGADYFYEL